MVGRDGVAEDGQRAELREGRHRGRRHREALEERRLLDVRGRFLPAEACAGTALDALPLGGGVGEGVGGVLRLEHLGLEAAGNVLGDFGLRGPEVLQEDGLAIAAGADGFVVEVDVGAAGEGERNDEGRRHEEVGLHGAVDAGFEVAVTREHRGGDEVAGLDGAFDVSVERAGVADTGRTTVADEVEAELVEVRRELRLVEVVSDDAGAGG